MEPLLPGKLSRPVLITYLIASVYYTISQTAKPVTLPFLIPNETLNLAFTPDGQEAFFTITYREAPRTYIGHAIKQNGQWVSKGKASFTSGTHQETMPVISRDGKTLVFFSTLPYEGKPGTNDLDAFICTRTDGGWSAPRPWHELNSDSLDYFGSFARNGNFYFTSSRKGTMGQEDIWKKDNGKTSITNVGAPVNTMLLNSIPAIAPDESFMLFFSNTKIEDDHGAGDLYISFNNDKQWSKPMNTGPLVNTAFSELLPVISHNGKTLYFIRATKRGDPPYNQWNYNLYEVPIKALRLKELRRRAEY